MLSACTTEQVRLRTRYAEIGGEIASARYGRTEGFDYAGWSRLRDERLWHLIVPPEYGGEAEDWWGFTAALEGLSGSIRTPELLLSDRAGWHGAGDGTSRQCRAKGALSRRNSAR